MTKLSTTFHLSLAQRCILAYVSQQRRTFLQTLQYTSNVLGIPSSESSNLITKLIGYNYIKSETFNGVPYLKITSKAKQIKRRYYEKNSIWEKKENLRRNG